MSPERIRPGSARARQTTSGPAAADATVDDAALERAAAAGDVVAGAELDEEALAVDDATPIAVPLAHPDGPGGLDPMITGEEEMQFVGPQPDDEPLRPDEFVSLEAAEQVLGHDAVEAYERGARRVPARDEDEVDEELLELDTAPAGPAVAGPGTHENAFQRLYHGRTRFDFVRRRRVWFTISGLIILAGAISLGFRGLNLGIDFAGGTSWEVRTATSNLNSTAIVNNARTALDPLGLGGSTITILGSNRGTQTLQVQAKLNKGSAQTLSQIHQVSDALAHVVHAAPGAVSVTQVGPSWGSSVTDKAIQALIVFFVLISLYISIFFEWRMALAAVIAVVHDVLVTIGVYSLTGLQVTPDTVVAILTILGYSLYDTIVVFDRVRDNVKSTAIGGSGRITITDIVNLSMNQTLARSINTSLVAILPILSVLVLGADVLGATTLQYFGWALLIGLLSGAYSSIFIASPLVAMMKEREQRWRNVRERLMQRGTDHLLLSAEAVAAGALSADAMASTRRQRRAAAAAASTATAGATSRAVRSSPAPRRAPAAGGGRITPGSGRAVATGAVGAGSAGGDGEAGTGRVPAGTGSVRGSAPRPAAGAPARPPARKARKGRQR
jgi:preprotein translocase subunit SecF